MDWAQLFVWQFSAGFAVGLVLGGLLVLRAVKLTLDDARTRGGYRGHTPPDAGRILPPQGGSGTARPKATFSEPFGRAVAAMHPEKRR